MQQNIDKYLVRQRFLKNLNSYDQNAYVQKQMSENLVNKFLQYTEAFNFERALEIGCGTGFLTKEILEKLKIETYYLNDIVYECSNLINLLSKDYQQTNFHFIHSDAEELNNIPGSFNLILSNAVFQWFSNLELFIQKLYCLSAQNSYIVFSTFGKNNLHEINVVEKKSLCYFSKDEIASLTDKYFKVIHCSEENIQLLFDSPKDVLNHLKYTGTTGLQKEVWTKRHLTEFEGAYNTLFKNNNKVPLTYNPIYIIAYRR